MRQGILVCGLNGAGKSTFGSALAQALSYTFYDVEDFYFPQKKLHSFEKNYPYENAREKTEAEQLLLQEILTHPKFVFASVKGDFSNRVMSHVQYMIHLQVPRETRLARIKKRSFEKFGKNALPGGAFHEQERAFWEFAAARSEDYVTSWLNTQSTPTVCIDGTLPVADNLRNVLHWFKTQNAEMVRGKVQ